MENSLLRFESFKQSHPADFMIEGLVVSDNLREIPFPYYPSRTDCIAFAMCLEGKAEIEIDLVQYTMEKEMLCVIMPNNLIRLIYMSDDISLRFFAMSEDFAQSIQLYTRAELSVFLYVKDHPVIQLTEKETQIALDYYTIINSKRKIKDEVLRFNVVHSLLMAMLYEEVALLQEKFLLKTRKKTRKEEMFTQFRELIFIHFREHKDLNFYAKELNLSTKYLSSLSKLITGKTASEWIEEVVVLEAKALLMTPGMNVQMVADALNFPDQSFFGKYFKRITGMTPSQYRASN